MTKDAVRSRAHAARALTPPMGWNSWNSFRCYNLTERVILESADALVSSGMRDAGYEYVVVDDCWQDHRRGPDGALRAHPHRFPGGMAALGAQLHARGLKFGLYLSPGRRTCAMIYDGYPGEELGSFGHEQQDADMLAGWGVDYLKYDWCKADSGDTGLHERAAFERMAQALERTGRPIVYGISEYGRTRPWEWAPSVAQLWRTTDDITPSWDSVLGIVDRQHGLAAYAGPGAWNDPDMLEVGNAGLSDIESRTHLMLWAMLAAPLMAGNDLRTMSETTRALLTHPGLLSVAKDAAGRQGRRVARVGQLEFWRRELLDGHAVGVLNRCRHRVVLGVAERAALTGGVPGAVDVFTGDRDRFDVVLHPHEMKLWRFTAAQGHSIPPGVTGRHRAGSLTVTAGGSITPS